MFSLLVIMMLFYAAGCEGSKTEDIDFLEKRTSDYVSQFTDNNFDNFYKDSSEELRQNITQDALLQGWNAIIQVAGAPGESLGSTYTQQDGFDVIVQSITGTLFNINVTVSYDSNGQPAGIWTSIAPKDPLEPQSTDKWEEAPVMIGEKKLSGMLTLPKGAEKPPVVIMLQGSGASDMNEAIGAAPNRPFEDIAHGLAEQGVATLRYNKRTYQYPTDGADTIKYEVLDDAAAAVKSLANNDLIDSNRIYLLGHSLGGMLAPKITTDNPQIKGFISMAGTLRTLQDIIIDQNKSALEAEASLTDQQKKDQLAQIEAEIEKTENLGDGDNNYIMGMAASYWKSLNGIDSTAIVKNLDVPMLILQGSADFHVYPDKDYELWQTTLKGRDNVTFHLYEGLSHLFMPDQVSANDAPDSSVYNVPNHVAPQVITDIATWVKEQ
ncbi:MAG TPA: permease [Pelotomaculum sp.]|nr:permease [Pelotomaculum sp.]